MAGLRGWDEDELYRLGRSPGHIRGVAYLWDQVIRTLGQVDPLRFSYSDALRHVEIRSAEGIAGQTIRKELGCIRRGLRFARLHGHPAPKVEWPKVASSPKNIQAGRTHPLPVLVEWIAEMRQGPPNGRQGGTMQAAIQAEVCLRTGLRIEEARRVLLSWVEGAPQGDPVPAYLVVPAQAAKTRTEKRIGLTTRTFDLLVEAHGIAGSGQHLFPGDYRKAWASAAARIGYGETIRPRDLRHCYAEYSSTSGDLVSTSATLGHSSLKTTSIYTHGDGARAAVAPVQMETLMDAIRDPSPGPPCQNAEGRNSEAPVVTGASGSGGDRIRTSDLLRAKQLDAIIFEVVGRLDTAQAVRDRLIATGWVDIASGPLTGTPLLREVG